MREILFRGKRRDNGEWITGDLWHKPYGDLGVSIVNFFEDTGTTGGLGVIHETIGQYIQTVNNHRIFTGDIVKAYKHGDTESKPFIYEITERVGTYWFGNWTWIEFLNIFRYVEVIGNIFDNPELLEVSI